MRYPKIPIELRASKTMSEKNDKSENEYIRLPKLSRDYCDPQGDFIEVVCSSGETLELEIHRAFSEDCKNISKNRLINAADGKIMGFVTQTTYNKILNKNKKSAENIWVSESVDNLVLGSDPEFGLVETKGEMAGSFLYADATLPNSHNEQLGTDGPCMELRPNPSETVEDHVKNISKLLKIGDKKKELTDKLWWSGASYKSDLQPRRYTMGGHIHIGNPRALEFDEHGDNNPETVHRRVIRVLDELVGLPLTRIDAPEAAHRRKANAGGGPYGYFGDFRVQNGRFEWRTPSAVWLTHPNIARAVLGTVKAVSEECYRRMLDKKFDHKWLCARFDTKVSFLKDMECASDTHVKEVLHSSSPDVVPVDAMASIHGRLKKMSTYPKYKNYIDDFVKYTSCSPEKAAAIKFDKFRENWLTDRKFEL
jgi:hypothetical protein